MHPIRSVANQLNRYQQHATNVSTFLLRETVSQRHHSNTIGKAKHRLELTKGSSLYDLISDLPSEQNEV